MLLEILMKFVETCRENQISPTHHKNAKNTMCSNCFDATLCIRDLDKFSLIYSNDFRLTSIFKTRRPRYLKIQELREHV
jgi:hypothetical protein